MSKVTNVPRCVPILPLCGELKVHLINTCEITVFCWWRSNWLVTRSVHIRALWQLRPFNTWHWKTVCGWIWVEYGLRHHCRIHRW